jgi:hypothetical protein
MRSARLASCVFALALIGWHVSSATGCGTGLGEGELGGLSDIRAQPLLKVRFRVARAMVARPVPPTTSP